MRQSLKAAVSLASSLYAKLTGTIILLPKHKLEHAEVFAIHMPPVALRFQRPSQGLLDTLIRAVFT